jgi:DNA-directed RNA polymerase specialized sigma24 family protein
LRGQSAAPPRDDDERVPELAPRTLARTHPARPDASPVEVAPPECEQLLELLDALPYRQQAVLVLRYWLDLTEAEIAEALGCRPGTVKSLCARALTRLRKELGE